MGQPASKEARTERARSEAIDRTIHEDSKRFKKECKILLLGSGESGKSTIVKQMKIIHQKGYDAQERDVYRPTIYKNVLDSAATLARVVRRVGVERIAMEGDEVRRLVGELLSAFPTVTPLDGSGLPMGGDGETDIDISTTSGSLTETLGTLDDSGVEIGLDPVPFTRDGRYLAGMPLGRIPTTESPFAAEVLAQTHAVLTPALADAIWHISRLPVVEKMVDDNPGDFYLMDSAGYFFNSIHRIAAPTYVPNEEDILRARAKTTAITETRFFMGDLSIHMFDVGGQRSERKKWIHCFESVTSIIFCTALSEYGQVLEEERRVNRMRESLYLFESIINSRWFLRTSVILFLNKIDVFKRKLPKIPLGRYFPEYAGGNDLKKAAKYILWKFMQENRAKLTVYPHVTQATNTKNIRLVFAAVKETILQNALKDSGIL
ncbi:Heterotrimeric G-protein alpha subunit [Mycena indigotica]|uniref:Heterotrimeric G-protein alpha subunit n=1 Tax=Mycena indigotica TaxID=2126181 RepID=A0A8H6SCJ1_9AGAR|nr:Heterotrimeric G-protein alpha subunit [Mycena indigotica]KAF7296914.1 Heterotrimeric G-protein alpha subunit [Mycena indigotica]